jgi:hypothetical protein
MVKTVKVGSKEYKVIGTADDGLPIIKGIATTKKDGFDKNGNPKISVNINVPPIVVGVTPGEVE